MNLKFKKMLEKSCFLPRSLPTLPGKRLTCLKTPNQTIKLQKCCNKLQENITKQMLQNICFVTFRRMHFLPIEMFNLLYSVAAPLVIQAVFRYFKGIYIVFQLKIKWQTW